jgi:hypothetical protein
MQPYLSSRFYLIATHRIPWLTANIRRVPSVAVAELFDLAGYFGRSGGNLIASVLL